MYTPDDLQPINRNYVIAGVVFIILFSLVTYRLIYNVQQESPKPITSTQPETSISKNGNGINLEKYDVDSDGDKIPNFMEEILGTNIYASEITECEKANFSCSESPLNKKQNINIILDASTSMNILGKEKIKINEIRENILNVLNTELTAPYYNLAIYSFGNRGMAGNIPDNESCVSVLRHKALNTPPSDKSIQGSNFLKNYIPNGKSPLAFSLDQVSKTLNKEDNNLIIVITDGLDDCNGDVKRVITEIKNSGISSKIDIATYFSNEDANIYLREAVESNGGEFFQNTDIEAFIVDSSRNFIKQNWCKNKEVLKIKNCIDSRYKTANSYLNDQKNNRNLREEEKNKISNTQSILNFHQESNIRNYQTNLEKEFNNYFRKKD